MCGTAWEYPEGGGKGSRTWPVTARDAPDVPLNTEPLWLVPSERKGLEASGPAAASGWIGVRRYIGLSDTS